MPLETIPAEETLELPAESATSSAVPGSLVRHIASSTSALCVAVLIERGLGFSGNILVARLGGASAFGAYSLAITTANNIGTYAAGGIGSTATRFSGEYGRGTRGYPTLARALLVIAFASGLMAALALWLGVAPLARLLHKENLTGLLAWGALSAAGVIVLECGRGFRLHGRTAPAAWIDGAFFLHGLGMVSLMP